MVLHQWLDSIRWRLTTDRALFHTAVLGLLTGVLAGGVIVIFRLTIETCQSQFLSNPEDYESLDWLSRFLIPLLGALVVGGMLQWLSPQARAVGIVHVMERLNYHQAHMPIKNVLTQFLGASISLISGHSVGREGPSIHLGAGSASYLGTRLELPNATIRTLVGCGTAAAIAASFNTPLAGVIFAMEVVMMEYTIIGFIPVIVASVGATTVSRLVFGDDPVFVIPTLTLGSLAEIPYMLVVGLFIGSLASVFIRSLLFFTGWLSALQIWQRAGIAGLILGGLGLLLPEILGMGYDTVNKAMLGQLSLGLMLGILVLKLLATTACLGLGMPGGLIGPTLVVGATAGGTLGLVAQYFFGDQVASHGFYALIGMATMMGATLHAPLAALITILELTANPHVILPSMLAIVTAGIVNSEVFKQDSIFRHLMQARNLDYRNDAVSQSLRRIAVAGVMDRSVVLLKQHGVAQDLMAQLQDNPKWIVITHEQDKTLLLAADLVRYIQDRDQLAENIDLLAIPASRLELGKLYWQATLQEAYDLLEKSSAEALYVYRLPAPGVQRVDGIITSQHIEAGYRL